MNAVTKMSSKGQVVIPKDVRDALGWHEGQALRIVKSGDRAVLEVATPKRETIDWDEFRRRMPTYDGPPISIEDMNRAIEEGWAERVARRP